MAGDAVGTQYSTVYGKARRNILIDIVRPACGSALMPRQGPPGYNPYTRGSGNNYQPAALKQGVQLLSGVAL